MADPRSEEEIHRVSLDHLVVLESKEVLIKQTNKQTKNTIMRGICQRDTRTPNGQNWNNMNKIIK